MSSLVTPDTWGSLHTCPGSFSISLISDDFWWISGVFMWCPMEESASHPLSSAGWVHQVFKWRILDINYDDFRRRFQLCPPQVLNPTTYAEAQQRFCQNLEIFLEIKFYYVSWCQMSSLVTPHTVGSLHMCLGSFSRSLISDDFWCISGVVISQICTYSVRNIYSCLYIYIFST